MSPDDTDVASASEEGTAGAQSMSKNKDQDSGDKTGMVSTDRAKSLGLDDDSDEDASNDEEE